MTRRSIPNVKAHSVEIATDKDPMNGKDDVEIYRIPDGYANWVALITYLGENDEILAESKNLRHLNELDAATREYQIILSITINRK